MGGVYVSPIDLRLGRGAGQSSVPVCWVGIVELTRVGAEAMVAVSDCAGTEVDVDEEMNKELTIDPERALQTTPGDCLVEASRGAASCNHAILLSDAGCTFANPAVL